MTLQKAGKRLLRVLRYLGIGVVSLLLLLFLLPYLFPRTISDGIKTWTNNNINGKMNFSKVRLSFYDHFPSLTLTLHDFSLKGAPPYPNDTLAAAEEIAFGVNLRSVLFEHTVLVDEIYLDDARLNVQVDTNGNANYNILKTKEQKQQEQVNDSASASLKIRMIAIRRCHLTYHDRSIPMYLNADGFNYEGRGDLSNAVFDLASQLNIDALDFSFDGEEYLRDKKINAELLTQVNTNSLVLLFRKNDLRINKLKLAFTGDFSFLSNGYSMNFKAGADKISLYALVTALPPAYLKWLEQTDVKGEADLAFSLKGDYIASLNKKPDMHFDMNIRDGYVAYQKQSPASSLYFALHTRMPSLNTDSLGIDIDTFSFRMDQGYFDAQVHTLGLDSPLVKARVRMDMDLAKLQQATGFKTADLRGHFRLETDVNGPFRYHTDVKGNSVIDQVPVFTCNAAMSSGYFKMAQLPQGIRDISFNILASCKDGNYRHTNLRIDGLKATALNNFVQGHISVANLENYLMDAEIRSRVNLAQIREFLPMDSLTLSGQMALELTAKGPYAPEHKQFPKIGMKLDLQQGSVQTKYYPHPVSNIQLALQVSNTGGTAKEMQIAVAPLSFDFEGKPFVLQAQLADLSDLHYDITAKGELDIGKIYSVFVQDGLNVSGFAQMDLHFAGTQSDAMKKRFGKLNNSGTLLLRDIEIRELKYLPKPFVLREGRFRFRNDQCWFERFRAQYGSSDITLNGHLEHIINYALSDNASLKGSFDLKSHYLLVDEFMSSTAAADTAAADTSGVIVIPRNISMVFNAQAKTIAYDGLILQQFAGQMMIDSGQLRLNNTGFMMVGTSIALNASYRNTGTQKAWFDFSILAKEFDVHRAYKEVKLFHQMAPSAASAQGIISLDYKLRGRLDKNMSPVYPSLEGGGVLSVRNVKFKGFKLLNNASRESGKEGLKDPDVKNVDLKTTVAKNIITLEKVKIKMAGFRFRIEGQSDFDHHLKFKARLGLPPLGIIGIPMTITGTSDNPKVKVGKEESDPLEEKEDTEGPLPPPPAEP
ncbi:AsmA-like C-terminal region-containing protein [Rurimicrobium arvi]|uniref:AsmA-like C-terminal region-containing protein n=1 Tax=Rurimicrobium arvi TaxID=2049916 RepID=A0ABP8MNK7_9BACT